MLKKSLLWIAASVLVATTTYLIVRPKKSYALTDDVMNATSLFVLGDSQTKRHLGEAYKEVFDNLDVSYFGKEGATHEDYIKDESLLDNLQCADILVIQLGDNGIPNKESSVVDFVTKVKERCPKSIIFWGGPMKPVEPTIRSNYVSMTDPSSFKYLPNYIEMRRTWDTRLSEWLQKLGVVYVSNIDLQESQPLDAAFSDSRGGDGIHLDQASALDLANLMHKGIFKSEQEVL
jgi:hypothetical protein